MPTELSVLHVLINVMKTMYYTLYLLYLFAITWQVLDLKKNGSCNLSAVFSDEQCLRRHSGQNGEVSSHLKEPGDMILVM